MRKRINCLLNSALKALLLSTNTRRAQYIEYQYRIKCGYFDRLAEQEKNHIVPNDYQNKKQPKSALRYIQMGGSIWPLHRIFAQMSR